MFGSDYDELDISCVPAAEECEQLGPNYSPVRAKQECRIFRDQLIRQFGEPPFGAHYQITSNPHDFGTYYEVAVKYLGDVEEAADYAVKVQNEMPEYWDEQAKRELEAAGLLRTPVT